LIVSLDLIREIALVENVNANTFESLRKSGILLLEEEIMPFPEFRKEPNVINLTGEKNTQVDANNSDDNSELLASTWVYNDSEIFSARNRPVGKCIHHRQGNCMGER
jgi:hypothetical protein